MKRLTGDFDIASILYLDLSDRGLTSQNLGALTLCSSLCVLHLPLNALTSTAPLQTLTQLQELDLSANRISSLEGCDKLVALRKLCLAGNLIHHLETLMVLAGLTQLKDLSLKLPGSELNNPVCSSAGYDVYVEQSFPSLVWLDGEKIAGPGAELYSLDRQPHEKEESGRREGGEVERAMPGEWLHVSGLSCEFVSSVCSQITWRTPLTLHSSQMMRPIQT